LKYKVLPSNAEIDPEVALLQSALAVDAAIKLAEANRDVDGMLNGSALWLKISESIHDFSDRVQKAEQEHEEIVKAGISKIQTGFCVPDPESADIIAEEDLDNEESENE
jgi:hypothetical protein